ncbi:MAG: glycosyltransferase family 2 protein [Thermodesulfobacteriota bacterium]
MSSGGFSVVIPLYNHEKYIEAAMESVLRQSVRPAEIIVVDDGSLDGSASVAAGVARRHPEVVVCWSQRNQGAHQAINSGLHRATSEFVAILNSDDAYHPRRMEICLALLKKHPEAAAVATGLSFMNESGRSVENAWYRQARAFYDQDGDMALALLNGNFIMTTSNLVLRKSVFEEVGYFQSLRYAHDLEFMLRLLTRGKEILLHDEALLSYRIHQGNTIREEHARVRVEWAYCCAAFLQATALHPNLRRGGWQYWERFAAVTETHQLTSMVALFISYMNACAARGLDPVRYQEDQEFYTCMLRMAG